VYIGAQKYKEPLKRHSEGGKKKNIYINTFVFSDKHVAFPRETLQRNRRGDAKFLVGTERFWATQKLLRENTEH